MRNGNSFDKKKAHSKKSSPNDNTNNLEEDKYYNFRISKNTSEFTPNLKEFQPDFENKVNLEDEGLSPLLQNLNCDLLGGNTHIENDVINTDQFFLKNKPKSPDRHDGVVSLEPVSINMVENKEIGSSLTNPISDQKIELF